jgi:hypothetical protein
MRRLNLFLAIAIALSLAVALQADVVVKQKMNVQTGGFMNMEMDATEYFKGDKSYSGGTTKITGGMAAMMGEGTQTEFAQITRLDKGVMWNLEPDKKTYSETNLISFQETMTGGETGAGKIAGDPSEYEWTVDITTSDDEVDINSFKCKNVIGKANGVHKEDPENKMLLTYEYWYTKDAPGFDELMNYGENFSKVTGIDVRLGREATRGIFSEFGAQFDEMVDKMVEAGGYPIKTIIKVEGTESAGEGGQMPPEMRAMMGMTGKPEGEGGMMTVFSLTSEVQSIEKKSVNSSIFDIPEGYTEK